MPQLLSLSRAARLAGVSRGDLQRRIRNEGIKTFEGQIPVSTLLEVYPHVEMDRDPILEKLELIKTTAHPKSSYSDGWLPEPEVLIGRLHELNRVLVRTKSALNASEKLLSRIQLRLQRKPRDNSIDEVGQWINDALSRPQNDAEAEADREAQLFAKNMFLKIMTSSVKVQPSGHEFFVEGNESILEAGLKAGLHLDYGCSSGNCGACKSRVVSGEVQRIGTHDYVLSERERKQGDILACCWTAVTDVVLEAHEAVSASDLPVQRIRTKVTKVEPISQDAAILHLKTPRTDTLRFMAGQSVQLRDEDGNSSIHPIASCPCDGRHLEFLIHDISENGFAKTVLTRNIKTQVVEVVGPSGDFVLQEDSTRPAVFIAFGAGGFAPVKSLVEHTISIDHVEHLHLYRIDAPLTRSRLDNLCRAWSDSLDNFSFTLVEQSQTVAEIVAQISRDIQEPMGSNYYVAGNQAQIDAFLAEAPSQGLPEQRIRVTRVA